MSCPQVTEYNEAIQNLRSSMSDDELREGQPTLNSRGLPMPYSGNFSDVYKVHCPRTGNTWAVKCFTREVPGQRDRYREIGAHLARTRLPCMVECEYIEPGIRAGGQWHPVLKMRWVEGRTLTQFVVDYLDRPDVLRAIVPLWAHLSLMLREAEVAHADLQHGNVLLVPEDGSGRFALKLVDYDGMWVPALSGRPSGELGHPAYQHPQRVREGGYSLEVDRFSHLAICTALHSLSAEGRGLWDRFDTGDNLLFREGDFLNPAKAEVFQELWALPDPEAHALVGRLLLATQTALDRAPLLHEIMVDGHVRPLSTEEERQAAELLGRAPAAAAPTKVRKPLTLVVPEPPELSASGTPQAPKSAALDVAETPRPEVVRPPWPEAVEPQWPFPPPPRPHRAVLVWALMGTIACAFLLAVLWWHNPGSTLPIEITNSIGMKMVLIPAGEFMMGSPDSDADAQSDEKPQHPVRITKPFYLGAYEVTVGQFRKFVEDSGYKTDAEKDGKGGTGFNPSTGKVEQKPEYTWRDTGWEQTDEHPVVNVSWNDAVAFGQWLSRKEGKTYLLPTEAEWEYACRAGTTMRYWSGDDAERLVYVGNVADATAKAKFPDWEHTMRSSDGYVFTAPVGRFRANTFGLYDMHGNVWEWCSDWYDTGYYGNSRPDDPTGPAEGSYRVVRGSGWLAGARSCRSADRSGYGPGGDRDGRLGFRVARVAESEQPPTPPVPKAAASTAAPAPKARGEALALVNEIKAFSATERQLIEAYNAGVRQSNNGQMQPAAFADLIQRDILPKWSEQRRRLERYQDLPGEMAETHAKILQYMTLREDSWRLRVEAMRGDDMTKAAQADEKSRAADGLAKGL